MAISISINNGNDGFRLSDFTVGASAPGTGDIELRYNATDGGGNAITRKALTIALEAFIRAVNSDAFVANPTGL